MQIQPINGYALLEPVEVEERTAGGIYLPDTAKDQPAEGKILALASGSTDEVAIGDKVIYKPFSGEEITGGDGRKLRLVPVGDLLAKYVDADEI